MQHESNSQTKIPRELEPRSTRSAAQADAERRQSIAAYKLMSQQERLRHVTSDMLADMKPDGEEFNRRFVARRRRT